ncbi:hypothetical protein L1987_12524 [Smallanthus sonchifolius]|uniref:Uncharacterized protein n=2 Tax=Smallanthus sonchifolius TaxID=185202 RepID=A0ACB9JE06_9ASTR|nr:hypothetical protein L1987_12524 [Smallanthus sonchifolius]
MFTLKFFHGGQFSNHPGIEYVNGKITFIDNVDIDGFGMGMLEEMVKGLGYPSDMVFYYHFKIPRVCLDLGLKCLSNDSDFENLFAHVRRGNTVIEIYIEHWNSRVFFKSINIEEEESEDSEHEDSEEEDDPDYIADKDNQVEDVEVDMQNFKANVDFDVDGDEEEDGDCGGHQDFECDGLHDSYVDLENFDSNSDSNDENTTLLRKVSRRIRRKRQHSRVSSESPCPFYIGQLIEDKGRLNDMVKHFALESRRQLYILKNESLRYRVVCLGTNPSLDAEEGTQGQNSKILLSEVGEHQCLQTREVGLYTMSSIAKEIELLVEKNPEIPITALQDVIQKRHQVQVSLPKVFRAKRIATRKLFGDYVEQYGLLRDYCEELLRANPGSTIKIDVEPSSNPSSLTRQFRRIYICYGAMKKGFKTCGREILGLDGCFMKGPYPGQILSAVGVDGNNGIYPVAFSLVEAESFQSWSWFLELLMDDLDLPKNTNFTFISDRQKGLIPALSRVFPDAEHRFCLRHIHENMRKQWRGDVFKSMLWRVASATTLPFYDNAMDEIKRADKTLFEWLSKIPPTSWSRAHFSTRANCDMLLNNICEVFNRQLIGARDKPVITCLEYIREYITKRIVNVKKIQARSTGPLTPAATNTFDTIKKEASQLTVLMVDSAKYQVKGSGSQCVVNVELKTCTCRKWELTGMPCKHAVAAIWDMTRNDMRAGIPESWVSEVYWLDTWKKVYSHVIDPIPGPEMWKRSHCPTQLTPPKHHKQIGRPKKMRKKSIEEIQAVFSNGGKMTRKGNTTTCGKCGTNGHNIRTCNLQSGTQDA